MGNPIALDKLSTLEKLRVLEEVWEDLCRCPEEIPVPHWHADVLSAREERVQAGLSRFGEWDQAKARLRRTIT